MIKKFKMYINGEWVDSSSDEIIEIKNPATGETIATIPKATSEDVEIAVRAADEAKASFKEMPVTERVELCYRVAAEIENNLESIAKWLTMEQGKPYHSDSLWEVSTVAGKYRLCAEEMKCQHGELVYSNLPGKKIVTVREPVGAYGVIVSWDYPILFSGSFCSTALATGNTIVLKPSSHTPISSILLAECYEKAGVPKGILNVVTGPGAKTGKEICMHPLIDAIGFVGETITGKRVCEIAGLKKISLGLGGTGPLIVLADANIPAAARAACDGSMLNAGQICSSTERVLVHNSVKDKFIEESLKHIKSMKVGDPMSEYTFMGPLNNEDVIRKVEDHIADAVSKGAKVVCGGNRIKGLGSDLFFEPTIIDGVFPGMLVHDEETYGPVISITSFDADEDAVNLANGNGYGLQMAVFTSDLRKMDYYSSKLKAGGININDGTIYDEDHMGFGGAPGTKSGYSRIGGRAGLEEMTYVKVIYIDLNNFK